MNFEVEQLTKEQWKPLSENAHLIAFNEHKPAEWDRIDFALIVKRGGQLLGYVTCREFDAHSLYFQYGGALPGTKGTSVSFSVLMRLIWWAKSRYKRVSLLIENTNVVMIKMAMKVGFRIIGIRNFNGHVLLEHCLEFQ